MKPLRLFYLTFLSFLLAQSPHKIEHEGRTYESIGRIDGKFGWIYEECGPDYKVKVVYKKKNGEVVSKILDDFCVKEIPVTSVGQQVPSPYPPAGSCYRNELRKKHFEVCIEDEYYKINFDKIDSAVFDSTTVERGAYRTYGKVYSGNDKIECRFKSEANLYGTTYNELLKDKTGFNIDIATSLKGEVQKIIFIK